MTKNLFLFQIIVKGTSIITITLPSRLPCFKMRRIQRKNGSLNQRGKRVVTVLVVLRGRVNINQLKLKVLTLNLMMHLKILLKFLILVLLRLKMQKFRKIVRKCPSTALTNFPFMLFLFVLLIMMILKPVVVQRNQGTQRTDPRRARQRVLLPTGRARPRCNILKFHLEKPTFQSHFTRATLSFQTIPPLKTAQSPTLGETFQELTMPLQPTGAASAPMEDTPHGFT